MKTFKQDHAILPSICLLLTFSSLSDQPIQLVASESPPYGPYQIDEDNLKRENILPSNCEAFASVGRLRAVQNRQPRWLMVDLLPTHNDRVTIFKKLLGNDIDTSDTYDWPDTWDILQKKLVLENIAALAQGATTARIASIVKTAKAIAAKKGRKITKDDLANAIGQ